MEHRLAHGAIRLRRGHTIRYRWWFDLPLEHRSTQRSIRLWYLHILLRRRPSSCWTGEISMHDLLQLLPGHKNYVVVLQSLLELGAVHDVIIALAPSGSPPLVIDHHRLQLTVVTPEMHNDFGKTRLEIGNRLQIPGLPLIGRNIWLCGNQIIYQYIPS